jgi:hypothetical protein
MEAEDNRRGSKAMKTGLVDQIQTTLKTFRASASVQGEPDFRELAVTIVRVFHEFIGEELTRPDQYDREQPDKGPGLE